jgi:hypothetical protein
MCTRPNLSTIPRTASSSATSPGRDRTLAAPVTTATGFSEGNATFSLGFDRVFRLLALEHRPQVLGGQGSHPVASLDGGAADVRGEDGVLEFE